MLLGENGHTSGFHARQIPATSPAALPDSGPQKADEPAARLCRPPPHLPAVVRGRGLHQLAARQQGTQQHGQPLLPIGGVGGGPPCCPWCPQARRQQAQALLAAGQLLGVAAVEGGSGGGETVGAGRQSTRLAAPHSTALG